MAYYCGNLSFPDFLLTLIYVLFIVVLITVVPLGCSASSHPQWAVEGTFREC